MISSPFHFIYLFQPFPEVRNSGCLSVVLSNSVPESKSVRVKAAEQTEKHKIIGRRDLLGGHARELFSLSISFHRQRKNGAEISRQLQFNRYRSLISNTPTMILGLLSQSQ